MLRLFAAASLPCATDGCISVAGCLNVSPVLRKCWKGERFQLNKSEHTYLFTYYAINSMSQVPTVCRNRSCLATHLYLPIC
ncbi:hypothetical protein F5B20DRAFT_561250 [Whalleya microplaca]|nr:hypothetical protein F5B20DRAFT_561250 [Whalleya microplaca]